MTGFNPFAPGAADDPDTSDLIAGLSRTSVDSSLQRALDDMGEMLARIDERDAERGEDGVPSELVPLLETLTGAEDAPLAYRSLHRRVQHGTTTWDAFWRAPEQESDGLRLMSDVLRASHATLRDGIAQDPAP